MNKADLYREGARLPEQLSRLLFLDGMVEGRRVLEVGATSDAVARFLLELGAKRVVCAVDDKPLLESLRAHSDLQRVDFRALRQGSGTRPPAMSAAPILPGDDGAFDLVIDFGLPALIARGETGRLRDITRVLSRDGFALTSLVSPTAAGLATLLDPAPKVVAPAQAGYRAVVEALQADFELVQVYFQSLLLGYLFGSFDAEPKDDGIAPQTLLMADEPEPAGSYLFAFGNAVPVIDDVCLVQVPFDALLAAFAARRGARNFEDETERLGVPALRPLAHRPLPALADSEAPAVDEVTEPAWIKGGEAVVAELKRLEDAVAEREATIDLLRAAVSVKVSEDPNRTLRPDEADAALQGNLALAALAQSLDDAVGRLATTEGHLSVVREELARAVRVRDALRADRDSLAEHTVESDRERAELARQLRVSDDERELLVLRTDELEETIIEGATRVALLEAQLLDVQTRAEGERQRQRVERDMLDATLSSHAEQVQELEAALAEADADRNRCREILLAHAERAEDETRSGRKPVDVEVEPSTQDRLNAAEAVVVSLRERVVLLEEALSAAEAAARAEVDSVDDIVGAAERGLHDEVVTALARAAASETRAADLEQECAGLHERVRSLEGDAQRLAEGVKVLVGERAARRHDDAEGGSADEGADVADAEARAAAAIAALDEARALLQQQQASAAAELDALAEKRRIDQAALAELRARLQETRGAVDDVTAQRTVLQQALAAREAQLHERRADQTRVQQELDRAAAALSEQQKRAADVDAAAAALSVEVRRLNAVVEETAHALRDVSLQRDEARARAERFDLEMPRRLEQEQLKRRVAEDEALAALEQVESERARLQAAFAAENARLLAAVEEERAAQQSAEQLARSAAVRAAIDDTVLQAGDLLTRKLAEAQVEHSAALQGAEARFAVEKNELAATATTTFTAINAEHEATRDELARITEALLIVEERITDERATHARELAALTEALDDKRILEARLAEQLSELRAERQRTSDEAATLAGCLRDSAAAVAEGEIRIEAATVEIARLHARLAQVDAEAAALVGRVAESTAAFATLAAGLDEERARSRSAESDVDTLQATLVAATTQLAAEAALRVSVEAEALILADRLAAEGQELEAVEAERQRAETALVALRQEQVDAALHVAIAEDEVAALSAKLLSAESALADLQQQLDQARHTIDDVGRRAADESAALSARLDEGSVELESTRDRLAERERALEDQRSRALDLEQHSRELQAELEAELDAERARLGEQLEEWSAARAQVAALREELATARADAAAGLQGLRAAGERVSAQRELLDSALAEARSLLSVERARGDLFHDELIEAADALAFERARGDLFHADLLEAQQVLGRLRSELADVRSHGQELQGTLDDLSQSADHDAVRADLLAAQLDEAQHRLLDGEAQRHRAELLQAQLVEADQTATHALTRAAELAAELADADEVFERRRLARESEVEAAAAEHLRDIENLRIALTAERAVRADSMARAAAVSATEAAAAVAAAARLQGAEEAHAALVVRLADTEAAALDADARRSSELGSLSVLVESLRAEITGLRDSLEMARDDGRESLELQQQTHDELVLIKIDRDALAERLNVDNAGRAEALVERDAAVAAAAAAAERTRLEARRRAELEEALLRLRAEHEKLLGEKAEGDGADDVDANVLRERLEALEKAAKAKDQKIAEQAERINRLTERIVRSEGLS